MNRPAPTVTVVMPNYNGARHLERAISSVLGQTMGDLELIVVDDVSTDDSAQIITRWAKADPRVSLMAQEQNLGPSAARNRALGAARGLWIAFIDSDDELAPDRLSCLIDRAKTDGADVVADNQTVFSDTGTFQPYPLLAGRRFKTPRWITPLEFVRGGTMYGGEPDFGYLKPVISARVLQGLRYDEAMRVGEDYDFMLRLLMRTGRIRLEPRELYRYRKHADSISHRLKPAHLVQMLDVQARFRQLAGDIPADLQAALDRRGRSLNTMLAYERIVEGLKGGLIMSSLISALAQPRVWPLLARPLQARLKRIGAAARQPGAAGSS